MTYYSLCLLFQPCFYIFPSPSIASFSLDLPSLHPPPHTPTTPPVNACLSILIYSFRLLYCLSSSWCLLVIIHAPFIRLSCLNIFLSPIFLFLIYVKLTFPPIFCLIFLPFLLLFPPIPFPLCFSFSFDYFPSFFPTSPTPYMLPMLMHYLSLEAREATNSITIDVLYIILFILSITTPQKYKYRKYSERSILMTCTHITASWRNPRLYTDGLQNDSTKAGNIVYYSTAQCLYLACVIHVH